MKPYGVLRGQSLNDEASWARLQVEVSSKISTPIGNRHGQGHRIEKHVWLGIEEMTIIREEMLE